MAFALTRLETTAGRFLSTLPPASAILPPTEKSPRSVLDTPASHVVTLCALTEVYHILGDVDGRALDGRLACADRLAQLAKRFSELDLRICHGVSAWPLFCPCVFRTWADEGLLIVSLVHRGRGHYPTYRTQRKTNSTYRRLRDTPRHYYGCDNTSHTPLFSSEYVLPASLPCACTDGLELSETRFTAARRTLSADYYDDEDEEEE